MDFLSSARTRVHGKPETQGQVMQLKRMAPFLILSFSPIFFLEQLNEGKKPSTATGQE